MYTGHCLCGDIRFNFDAPDRDVNICHCSLCRRMTGTAFGTYVKVREDALHFAAPGVPLNTFAVTDKLTMNSCANCGSYLYATHSDYPAFAYVCLGVVDDNDELRPTYHEFVGSKASWYEIHDGLPQFTDWSDED
jgi:hypothetical protein